MNEYNFNVTFGWMYRLKLTASERDIFSIIHGFTQDGENEFTGSLNYLSDYTGYSRRTVIASLQSLVDKGLLIKKESLVNGVKYCSYKAVSGGGEKISPVVQNLHRGGEKIAPNNIRDNIDNNTLSYSNAVDSSFKGGKVPYGEYRNVPLSTEEYEKFCAECPQADKYIEEMSGYIAQSGKKYRNYLAALRNWYKRDLERQAERTASRSAKTTTAPHGSPSYNIAKFKADALNDDLTYKRNDPNDPNDGLITGKDCYKW